MTTSETVSVITKEHDKIAHCVAFMIESWLFVMMIQTQIISLPNPLKFNRHNNDLDDEIGDNTSLDMDSDIFNENHNIEVNKYIMALILCSGVAGLGSEIVQKFLSGGKRSFDLFDVLFDTFGSLTGIAIAYFHEKFMYKDEDFEEIPMTF